MKIHLLEPNRWNAILQKAIDLSNHSPQIATFAPIGADIFVFIYPTFLIILYLKGIIKKQLDRKEGALFIFFSCFISIAVNIGIQSFFLKNRPHMDLSNEEMATTVLHQWLPSSSFPSDHAVVGMSIAIATLIRGYKTKNSFLIFFWYFLILCALIMGFCRIMTLVHRPSDIFGGFLVAIIIPLMLSLPPFFFLIKKWLISPSIKFQEWIYHS